MRVLAKCKASLPSDAVRISLADWTALTHCFVSFRPISPISPMKKRDCLEARPHRLGCGNRHRISNSAKNIFAVDVQDTLDGAAALCRKQPRCGASYRSVIQQVALQWLKITLPSIEQWYPANVDGSRTVESGVWSARFRDLTTLTGSRMGTARAAPARIRRRAPGSTRAPARRLVRELAGCRTTRQATANSRPARPAVTNPVAASIPSFVGLALSSCRRSEYLPIAATEAHGSTDRYPVRTARSAPLQLRSPAAPMIGQDPHGARQSSSVRGAPRVPGTAFLTNATECEGPMQTQVPN